MRNSLVGLLAALVLPACGSTVQTTAAGGDALSAEGLPLPAASGDGMTVPGAPSGSSAHADGTGGEDGGHAAGPAGAGAPVGVVPGSEGAAADSARPAGSVSGAGGTSPGGRAGGAPGVTADKIYIGGVYSPDAAAGNAALGAESSNTGDQRDYFNAVIREVNSRGGVLGRKLQGVWAPMRASSSEPVDQQTQAACGKWFQDNKVFVVYDDSPVAHACTAKAGAVAYGGGSATGPVYARNPHLVGPESIRLERLSAVTVNAMVRLRWHVPGGQWPTGKIGVITWDDPTYKYGYDEGTKKALARHGLKVEEVRFIKVPQTASGISESSAAINNAVLKFQEEQIDHVLIQDGPAGMFSGGGLTLLFLQSAEGQLYRPRYGFNANNFPGDAAYPARQQHGMLAVDHHDYTAARDEGIAPNKNRIRCFEVMRKANLPIDSDQNQGQAALACDYVWFVEHTFSRAAAPTRDAFLAAVDATGSTFGPSFTYGTRFAPGRRDGIALFRTSRYEEGPAGCGCMRYTSGPFEP